MSADVFIAPEGALQFEILPQDRRISLSNAFATTKELDRIDTLWAYPPVANRIGCSCPHVFPIISDSLSPRNQDLTRHAFLKGQPVICFCQGRIIE